jgi:hypothetical protein
MSKDIDMFLLIGCQKTGTTSIYDILLKHPELNLANKKETKFFIDMDLYRKGISYYNNHYFDSDNGSARLDIDPDLIFEHEGAKRIYNSFGKKVQFIVIFRNPAKRAYSQYLMEVYRSKENLSFQDAIIAEEQRINTTEGRAFNAYLERGYYSKQLKEYLKYFPLENFKFYLFEKDFIARKEWLFKDLLAYLKVDPNVKLDINLKRNPRRKVKSKFVDLLTKRNKLFSILFGRIIGGELGRRIRHKVYDLNAITDNIEEISAREITQINNNYFKGDILRLEKLINRDLSHWLL